MVSLNNRRVLVVDDDSNLLEAYRRILGRPGKVHQSLDGLLSEATAAPSQQWELTLASQGEEGVERVREAFATGLPYAVALVDVRMPPGIDGVEAARQMRQIDPEIGLGIITAFSDRSVTEMQQQLQHGFMLLRKPFEAEEVSQLVNLLAQHRAARAGE